MSEPIYRDMCQSHQLYTTTLDRWRVFEADNERRTEAYWHKMLQGGMRKKSKQNMQEVRQKASKNVTAVRTFCKRANGEGGGWEGTEDDLILDHVDTVEEDPFDGAWSPASASDSPGHRKLREQRLRRMDSVKCYFEEKDKEIKDKALKNIERMEKKLALGRQKQAEKSQKAGQYVEQWQQKANAVAERRMELSNSDDSEAHQRMLAAKQKLEEMQEEAARARND